MMIAANVSQSRFLIVRIGGSILSTETSFGQEDCFLVLFLASKNPKKLQDINLVYN
jgi:hypothetical protein